ncbi:serine hydrolase domain-containing protein [Synechocystis salina]|uniref:Beta-lactamase family protein n=1 Tax=Synechocystis salina LEGE 00031 TaxID=1828736 RepID=A0ABR9VM71_9SYNC|nr:serine hydrolase domain-containing protein [Synechocystis salina]MBE9239713.1 beta-lactamase family protein [Synechocystis salina LEGE 00041]MBE9252448.1 beta-lactamase family protein [Synechocystis salina LEGE 00031]
MDFNLKRRRLLALLAASAWFGSRKSKSLASPAIADNGGTALGPAAEILAILAESKQEYDLSALLCGIWQGEKTIISTAIGNSQTNVPATTAMHLRAGGVTITCICLVLLRLVDRGLVNLDDLVARWWPKLPRAKTVTLQQLANSTSGYADFEQDQTFIDANNYNPFRQWQTQELLDIAFATPLLYEPGESWNYSHTNFVVLGELLQRITGQPMDKLLEQEIFAPLGLGHSSYPHSSEIPPPVLHAFSQDRDVFEDSTYWNPSWTSFSGMMISTLGDLSMLALAIAKGSLLSPQGIQAQIAPTTVGLSTNRADLYYGLGIVYANGWLVQNPRFGGYNLFLAALPSQSLAMVVATTIGLNSSDEAHSTLIARKLVQSLNPNQPIPNFG